MDVAVVQQFISFFQDFIDLCQWSNWPNSETTETELKNAFFISHHIEKCLHKLQKNNTVDEFLNTLNSEKNSVDFLKYCLLDPPKYILKKVINSDIKISDVDVAFKIFLQLFPEQKLEKCLTDLMNEASSKEVLLNNLCNEIPLDEILQFQSKILLTQVNDDSRKSLEEMLKNSNQQSVTTIVVCLGLTSPIFLSSVKIITKCVLNVMSTKNIHLKKFWKFLFNVDDKHLIRMCVENCDVYYNICEALIDCGKLLKENMSAEYFYIDFTYPELDCIVKRLLSHEYLKSQFIGIVNNHGADVIEFWHNFM